jgi:PHD/YefM family antitoxin component YafN of YafNO toxin-antitoxin module
MESLGIQKIEVKSMYQVTSDYAQTHFGEILHRAAQESEGVVIVQENKNFVLIAQDELEALIETTELLKDPTLLSDIEQARQEYLQGEVLTMDQVLS